ncbi:MAG: MBL fold metallo-hydrolase [Candidatus Sumerlaeota bacterium]|nr:MBL fold metallo-hydrolase [Candidatus Sumerlaeota bacterium]
MTRQPVPLQVIPLGVGDYFSRVNYTTTFLVLGGTTRMLIDCSDPLQKELHEATTRAGLPLGVNDIDAVLLTHLHGDHANGLEGLGFFRKQAKDSPGRPTIYLLPEVLTDLWERRLRGPMGRAHMPTKGIDAVSELTDYFDPHPVEPGKPFRVGDLEIEARRSRHVLPCMGCKIHYGGRTLGYSSDTDYDPAHIEFLSDSDLIFHETSGGVHADYQLLAKLPEPLRKRMRLVHLPDDFDRASSAIEPAEAGKVYVV